MAIEVETLHRTMRRADLLDVRIRILERMERRAQRARTVVGLPRDERDGLDEELSMLAGYWDEINGQLDALDALDGTDGSRRRTGADVLDELKRAR